MSRLLHINDLAGAYPPSWYAATATPLAPQPPLKGAARADLCVVGGGLTGLWAALTAARAGLDVVLLEAQRLGFGASGRNGGQLATGWRSDQFWLEDRMGRDTARQLWALSLEAVDQARDFVAAHAPEAGYRPGIAYTDWSPKGLPALMREAEHLARQYGYDALEPLDRDACRAIVKSDAYHGGVLDHGAGHLHPLRYALALARAAMAAGVRVHEGAEVHHIAHGTPARVQTAQGHVLADHVILATNGYGALDRRVKARVMPINSYVAVTEPLDDPTAVMTRDIAVADSKFVVNYFRLTEGRLLFGGGESYGYRFPSDIAAKVRKPMLEVFPQLRGVRFSHAWGGTLAITMHRLPHVARLAPNVLSAGGYSGHGVALSGLAGRVLAEAVAGQAGRFDLLSTLPVPPFPGGGGFRTPLLTLAMTWFALRDRLGI